MPVIKEQKLSKKEKELLKVVKALAHPARLSILKLMLERNSCICGELTDEINLSQSTISQHIKELKEAGLIYGTEDYPRRCYCIHPENWKKAQHLLNGYFNSLSI